MVAMILARLKLKINNVVVQEPSGSRHIYSVSFVQQLGIVIFDASATRRRLI